jgi:hypothetical protein
VKFDYGTETTETSLDEHGSILRVANKYHGGNVARTIKTFELYEKVHDPAEEAEQYKDFTTRIAADPNKFDTAFKIKKPKQNIDGSYFVVKCWSENA